MDGQRKVPCGVENEGPTEIRTRIAGFKVQSANNNNNNNNNNLFAMNNQNITEIYNTYKTDNCKMDIHGTE